MQYFFEPGIPEGTETLNEEESVHCIKVFRHKEGDQIGLIDGKGGVYKAVIRKANPKNVVFEILERNISPSPSYQIHLVIAPTKNADRMEWLVEKLAEIGVTSINLVFTQNSERRKYRIDRLQKKIIAALKQSKNPFAPQLYEPVDLQVFLNKENTHQKFIAFVDPENPDHLSTKGKPDSSYTILIGPEGDFTKEELYECIAVGYEKVSLGNHVLRTETAGLMAVHTLHLINT
ncbi:MAG: RsmE family RNA methyltransferase [Candidatus Cyclobacteriaceae bacterium M2_1C_046]